MLATGPLGDRVPSRCSGGRNGRTWRHGTAMTFEDRYCSVDDPYGLDLRWWRGCHPRPRVLRDPLGGPAWSAFAEHFMMDWIREHHWIGPLLAAATMLASLALVLRRRDHSK